MTPPLALRANDEREDEGGNDPTGEIQIAA
jgi:hypothetical protein